ncbi:MAG: thioredoxin family protein [Acidimicrobiia bacterium]|nr:thioredoxin family protein [Acidimicrobiia bacterium]
MKTIPVQITVQHFNDCPNWRTLTERLEQVIESTGADAVVRLQLVNTPEAAEEHSFRGSPTILIDGIDPFANPDAPVGLACRVFHTPDGPAGSPTVEQLAKALAERTN